MTLRERLIAAKLVSSSRLRYDDIDEQAADRAIAIFKEWLTDIGPEDNLVGALLKETK